MARNYGKLVLFAPSGIILPEGEERSFTLTKKNVTVGSAESNDIVVDDPNVSRVHARIESNEEGSTLIDLDSSTGTFVNNHQSQRNSLAHGDELRFGSSIFRFESFTQPIVTDPTVVEQAVFAGESAQPTSGRVDDRHTEAATTGPLSLLIPLQPNGSKPPLFVVTEGSDDAPVVAGLLPHLGADQPLYVLRPPLPGAAKEQTPTINVLAASYVGQITNVQIEEPYLIVGYSLGGIVAFEVAQQLLAQGKRVALLAMLDTPYLGVNPLAFVNYRIAQQVERLSRRVARPIQQFLHSDAVGQLREVGERAAETGPGRTVLQSSDRLLRSQPVRDTMQSFWGVFEAERQLLNDPGFAVTLQAVTNYLPRPYPGRIVFFHATESLIRYSPAPWYWRMLAANGLSEHLTPGRHETILREPHVPILAKQLQIYLDASAQA